MTDHDLELHVREVLASIAPGREPGGLLDDVLLTTGHIRQRPGWLAFIKEPPMRVSNTLAVGSPTGRVAALLAAMLLLTLALAGAGIAGSRLLAAGPIVVDQAGGGTVETLAEAVAMAESGATILVRPGTYTEAVIIDKDVSISGDGPREEIVVSAPQDGPKHRFEAFDGSMLESSYVLLFTDSDATLTGLTISGVPSTLMLQDGSPTIDGLIFDGAGCPFWVPACPDGSAESRPSILIIGDSSAAIHGNTIRGGGPIEISAGAIPRIEGNEISEGSAIVGAPGDAATISDNTISGDVFIAIQLAGDSAGTVAGNVISGADTGIMLDGRTTSPSVPVIHGNSFSGTGIAIHSSFGRSALVEANRFEGNDMGIRLSPSGLGDTDGIMAAHNEFIDNATGVLLAEGASSLESNEFVRNRIAIHVVAGGPSIENNSIEGSEVGVQLGEDALPLLDGNRLCGNAQDLMVEAAGNPTTLEGNVVCPR